MEIDVPHSGGVLMQLKKILKTVGKIGVAALGALEFSVLFVPGCGLQPISYDEKYSKRDSAYAVKMAKILYEFHRDTANEKPCLQKIDPAVPHDKSVVYRSEDDGWAAPAVCVETMLDSARRAGKSSIVFDGDTRDDYQVDTAELRRLVDYKDASFAQEGKPAVPLYVDFRFVKNGSFENGKGFLQRSLGVYLTMDNLAATDPQTMEVIIDHEVGHAVQVDAKQPVFAMRGQGDGLFRYHKNKIAWEDDADRFAAMKRNFTLGRLAGWGNWLFLSDVEPDYWQKQKGKPEQDVVAETAALLYRNNVIRICYEHTHSPLVYRFINMAEQARLNID